MLMKFILPLIIQREMKKMHAKLMAYLPEERRTDPSKWLQDHIKPMFKDPKVQYMTVNGESYAVNPPFDPKVLSWALANWKPRSDDVIVATFPKTGKMLLMTLHL